MRRCLYASAFAISFPAKANSPSGLLTWPGHPTNRLTCRLELGAGGGLVGLAVAIGCNVTHPVVITDQENMFPLMQQNIALNGLEKSVRAEVLDW